MRTRYTILLLCLMIFCVAAGAALAQVDTSVPADQPEQVASPPTAPAPPAATAPPAGKDVIQVLKDAVVAPGETVTSVLVVGGSANISGHVTEDVTVVFGDARLRSGAVVDGDVVTVFGKVRKAESAVVAGRTETRGPEFRWSWDFVGALRNLILYIVFGILAYVLIPRRVDTISEMALQRPWRSALYGLIAILLFVPILLLLVVTIVGIPLIGIEILLYVALTIMGGIGIRYAVGRKIAESRQSTMSGIRMIVIGSIIMAILNLIPFLGNLAYAVLSLVGIGAAAVTWFGSGPDWLPNRFRRLDAGRAGASERE